jgi:hypothetical protein
MAGAVFAVTGLAHAQSADERAAQQAETPWYERFTYSQAPDAMTGGALGPEDQRDSAGWRVNGRWSVTVDLSESARRQMLGQGAPQNETAVGAYFQFTPTVRVGGEVSVAPAEELPGAERDSERADVRIQSAFRF